MLSKKKKYITNSIYFFIYFQPPVPKVMFDEDEDEEEEEDFESHAHSLSDSLDFEFAKESDINAVIRLKKAKL